MDMTLCEQPSSMFLPMGSSGSRHSTRESPDSGVEESTAMDTLDTSSPRSFTDRHSGTYSPASDSSGAGDSRRGSLEGETSHSQARSPTDVLTSPEPDAENDYSEDDTMYSSLEIDEDEHHAQDSGDQKRQNDSQPKLTIPIKCQECNHSFHSNASFAIHQRKHTGERPFICDECGLGFTQKGNLSRHKQTHLESKPFKCDQCPYATKRKDALLTHKSTHFINKRYKCTFCTQAYKQRQSLRDHLKACHRVPSAELRDVLSESVTPGLPANAPPPPQPMHGLLMPNQPAPMLPRPSPEPVVFTSKYNPLPPIDSHRLKQDEMSTDEYQPLNLHTEPDNQPITSLHDSSPPTSASAANHKASSDRHTHYMKNELMHHLSQQRDHALRAAGMLPSLYGQRTPTSYASAYQLSSAFQMPPTPYSLPFLRSAPVLSSPYHTAQHLNAAAATLSSAPKFPQPPSLIRPAAAAECPPQSPQQRTSCATCEKALKCETCCVSFSDEVMYTIHLSLHSKLDPLKCNLCGFTACNRYEFASHIARGDHRT